MHGVGKRTCKSLALNQEEWKKLLKKVRAQTGYRSDDDDHNHYDHHLYQDSLVLVELLSGSFRAC